MTLSLSYFFARSHKLAGQVSAKHSCPVAFWALARGSETWSGQARKREQCACGCRKWCTTCAAWQYVAWLSPNQERREVPTVAPRWNEKGAEDDNGGLTGQPLGYRAVTVMVKADWAEFCHSIGFWSWSHHAHPWFRCFFSGGPEGNVREMSKTSPLWTRLGR